MSLYNKKKHVWQDVFAVLLKKIYHEKMDKTPSDILNVKLRFPVKPISKGRPRFNTKTGAVYTPTKTKQYETLLQQMAKIQYGQKQPFLGMISVRIRFLFRPPKIFTNLTIPGGQKDIDNLIKAILDALNGIVYIDDKQVITLHAQKEWACTNCTIVEIIEAIPKQDRV